MGAGPTTDRDRLLDYLVRLGQLDFDDFRLLDPLDLRRILADPAVQDDWPLALNNTPHILLHIRRSANLQSAICNLQSDIVPSLPAIRSAQPRLTHRFAFELLRAKAPPLYDVLPWNDWDFSIVARRFKLWQTRFLLAGDGTTVTVTRCRKSAGVYVVEPLEALARYIEKKGGLEKVKRLRVLTSSLYPSIPLPSSSIDLAIIGSTLDPVTPQELASFAANVVLIENNPLCPPLEEKPLLDIGFRPDSVQVRSLGPRRCWWRLVRRSGYRTM